MLKTQICVTRPQCVKDRWAQALGHQNGRLSVCPQIIVINVIPLAVPPPSSFFSLPLLLVLVELCINWKDLLEESCLQGLSAVPSVRIGEGRDVVTLQKI